MTTPTLKLLALLIFGSIILGPTVHAAGVYTCTCNGDSGCEPRSHFISTEYSEYNTENTNQCSALCSAGGSSMTPATNDNCGILSLRDQVSQQANPNTPTSSSTDPDQAALDKAKADNQTVGTSGSLSAKTKSLFSSGGYKVDSASANLPARVGRVISIIFAVSGTIFLSIVIYSGVRWMTAAGDSDEVKKSRKRVVRASIGLLIMLMSWILTNFVLRGVLIGAQSSGGSFQFTTTPGTSPIEGGSARFYR